MGIDANKPLNEQFPIKSNIFRELIGFLDRHRKWPAEIRLYAFLKKVNEGVIKRNKDKPTMELRENLVKLIKYLKLNIKKRALELDMLDNLGDKCKSDLRDLLHGGYLGLEREDFMWFIEIYGNFVGLVSYKLRQERLEKTREHWKKLRESFSMDQRRIPTPPPKPPKPTPPPAPTWHTPTEVELKLVAVLNKWWKNEKLSKNKLKRMLNRISLPASFYSLGYLEFSLQSVSWSGPYAFFPSDRDGGWLWCNLNNDEAVAVPAIPVFFYGYAMTIIRRMFGVIEGGPEGSTRFEKVYLAVYLQKSTETKIMEHTIPTPLYTVTSKGFLILKGAEISESLPPEPPEYEDLLPPLTVTPKIEIVALNVHRNKNIFLLDKMIIFDVKITNLNLVNIEYDYSIAESDDKGNLKVLHKDRDSILKERFEFSISAKDLGLGTHNIVFVLHDVFGDDKDFNSNIVTMKVMKGYVAIIEPEDNSNFYMNQMVQLKARVVNLTMPQEGFKYRFYDRSLNKILKEGTLYDNEVIIRAIAREFGSGEHLIAFELSYKDEEYASNPIKLIIIGGGYVEIISPLSDPKNPKKFFLDQDIELKARINNLGINTPKGYAFAWRTISPYERDIFYGTSDSQVVTTVISANQLSTGTHDIIFVVGNKETSIEFKSKPIRIKIRKRTFLHNMGIRK